MVRTGSYTRGTCLDQPPDLERVRSGQTIHQARTRTLASPKPKRSRFGCNIKAQNSLIFLISLPLPFSHLPKLSQISLSKRRTQPCVLHLPRNRSPCLRAPSSAGPPSTVVGALPSLESTLNPPIMKFPTLYPLIRGRFHQKHTNEA